MRESRNCSVHIVPMAVSVAVAMLLAFVPATQAQGTAQEGHTPDSDGAYPSFRLTAEDLTETQSTSNAHTDTKSEEKLSIYEPMLGIADKYSGDYFPDTWLTGDWGGARQQLVDNGIIFEAALTQIMQGNAYGGKDTNNAFRYSGSVDYFLKFDTARMNLWPGGLFLLHGETQFGQSINPKVGALMQPNTDALFPVPNDPGATTLSEFVFAQALSEWLVVAAGKIDATRVYDTNYFANDERRQFLNLGLRNNPVILPFAPYTTIFAAAIVEPTEWLSISTAVANSNDSANRTGFDTAFHAPDGTTVAQEFDFTIKPFGLEGHQRLGWVWMSKDSRVLGQDARVGLRALSLIEFGLQGIGVLPTDEQSDDWAFYYNFDQWVYTEPDDPEQGVGIFGRFGWSDGEANLVKEFYSIGMSATGIIPNRDKDVLGLGYYYLNLSPNLRPYGLSAEQGVELFYNIEVKPWLHITPDLQVIIDPGGNSGNDVALVYGLRAQMSF